MAALAGNKWNKGSTSKKKGSKSLMAALAGNKWNKGSKSNKKKRVANH